PRLDDAAGEGRLVDHDQNIKRVVVLKVGLRDEAVVAGVMERTVQHTVKLDDPGTLAVFVFVAAAFGDFDHRVDNIRGLRARRKLVPEMDCHSQNLPCDKTKYAVLKDSISHSLSTSSQ